MDIDIDPDSPVPVYQQIRDRIVEGIGTGQLSMGQTLLSVRALAGEFGINPNTVAKAYDLLKSEGFIDATRSGTRVASNLTRDTSPPHYLDGWSSRLHTLIAEARAHGVPLADLEQSAELILKRFESIGASS